MSSFFSNTPDETSESSAASTQAPVFTGTTTREQFAPETGASTVPSGSGGPTAAGGNPNAAPAPAKAPGSAAPSTAANGGGAQAPQFTNLSDYLNGQSQQQIQQQTNGITRSASSAADAANAAGTSALQSTQSAATAGTDNGSISQTTSSASTPGGGPVIAVAPPGRNTAPSGATVSAASSAYTAGTSALQKADPAGKGSTTTQQVSLSPAISPYMTPPTFATIPGATTTPTATPSVGSTDSYVRTGTSSVPTYDFSKANLAGYTGPNATATDSGFGAANSAANTAKQNAGAIQSGHPLGNAWDNALETQTPAWAQLQAAVSGDNRAVANVGAQQQGAQQAVTNAQNTSTANVDDQRRTLSTATAQLSGDAAAKQAAATTVQGVVQSGDYAGALKDPTDLAAFAALGIPTSVIQGYADGLASGSLNPTEINADLAGYVSAATSSAFTGYTDASAAQMNQADQLLGNGAPTVSAGTVMLPPTINTSADQAKQNQAGLSSLAPAIAQYQQLSNSPQSNPAAVESLRQSALQTLSGLLAQGYDLHDTANKLGISIGQLSNLVFGNGQGGGQSWDSIAKALPLQISYGAKYGAPAPTGTHGGF